MVAFILDAQEKEKSKEEEQLAQVCIHTYVAGMYSYMHTYVAFIVDAQGKEKS